MDGEVELAQDNTSRYGLKHKFWLCILISSVMVLLLPSMVSATWAAATGPTYDLTWNTISGGGASFTTGGNYTLGVTEQIIFPEIVLDKVTKMNGYNITFVTSANTDEEGYALLRNFGLPFKNAKKN